VGSFITRLVQCQKTPRAKIRNSKFQKTNPPASKSLSTLPPTTPPRNPVSANGNPSPPGHCLSFASGAFSNTSPCFETSNSCISGGMRLPRPSSGVEERELECGGAVGPGLEGWCCGRLDGRSGGGGSVALFLLPRQTSLGDFWLVGRWPREKNRFFFDWAGWSEAKDHILS